MTSVTRTEVSAKPDTRGYYTVTEHLTDGSKISYEVFASKARMEALTKNKQAKLIADAVGTATTKATAPAPIAPSPAKTSEAKKDS